MAHRATDDTDDDYYQTMSAFDTNEDHTVLLITALVTTRKWRMLSRRVVAERMGETVKVVKQIEKGELDPTLSQLNAYAASIGTTIFVPKLQHYDQTW